ncbi:MAG TPA: aspartate aminotransferase family protein [Chitinophagaceae bacterium]|nr:aspartate aminotransferase family protein [Chitinophagaceae bacterium]MCC6633952.1 aspartate aminotransferase family protein [Chitinophagaceae bacterium]HMZ45389.1 aspartate aminotransferase family protein [Chitinophagaceae bacterium]HNE92534.1 aspartate aminotransferase family protein [Chitinophagaceae bacterium]HNF29989.1 aspartate aminotransferase family protein [Chitinophagaceae bacterium]
MNNRQIFQQHLAQTSPAPIAIEMNKAEGIYLFDVDGKKYIDAISGFSVANIGHTNSTVVEAVTKQAKEYMHLIVYGEFIQQPQTAYAKLLTDNLPSDLNCVYFTNSGTEATEGALKLAKRATGRTKIYAFNNAYHGSTQGSLSVIGSEYWRNNFRPLLPEVYHFNYNSNEIIEAIDSTVACVIIEIVQAEAGIKAANKTWLQTLYKKCKANGVLFIVDEIQSGFGRTGSLWAFEQFEIIPDILLLGKALGGGMPLGAFIANYSLMNLLTNNPVLGHITTFGGHPISCVAGKAALEVLLTENLLNNIQHKQSILINNLTKKLIKHVNYIGLWAAIAFENFETNHAVIQKCITKGLITDWFLFAPNCMRLAPPLISTNQQLLDICSIINESIDEVELNQ